MTISDQDLTAVLQFHEKLAQEKFYGVITERWQDGQIVLVEKLETIKPKDFIRVDVRIT